MALGRIRKTPHFLLPRCEQFIQDRKEKMLLIQRIDIPDRVFSLYQKSVVQQYFYSEIIRRGCGSAIKSSELDFAALALHTFHFNKAIFRGALNY